MPLSKDNQLNAEFLEERIVKFLVVLDKVILIGYSGHAVAETVLENGFKIVMLIKKQSNKILSIYPFRI
jgi:hypothetical protein